MAALFALIESRRLASAAAALEGLRIWGVMTLSLTAFFVAFNTDNEILRVGIALIAPIAGALVINNAYVAIRQHLPR